MTGLVGMAIMFIGGTRIGYLAIALGILIALAGGLAGGNLFIIGIGLIAIALGGSTKKTKPCPFCRSAIDARATTCPKCAKDQPRP